MSEEVCARCWHPYREPMDPDVLVHGPKGCYYCVSLAEPYWDGDDVVYPSDYACRAFVVSKKGDP